MKKFSLLLYFLIIAFNTRSQTNNLLNQIQIDQLKLAGKLPVNFQSLKSGKVRKAIVPEIYPSLKLAQSGNACNCMIPIDGSFTVAAFDGSGVSGGPGVGPDYRNDDWSTSQIMLPFTFCYFGQSFNSVFINNNGNISFDTAYSTFTANSFPDSTFKMIAPFWADVDTRGALSGLVYYKVTPTSMIIKWDHVGYFSTQDNLLNTFQLIITDGSDSLVPNGHTAFCYGDMQWTTGSASGGTNGFGGTPATAGANLGDGTNYTQFGQFDQAGGVYDGQHDFNDGIDWLDSANFIFDLCLANVPPVALDCMNDTVVMLVTNTRIFDFYFLSPEIGQIATINLQTSLNNFTILSNDSGEYAHARIQVIADPANMGYNTILVTATDNGSTPATTSYARVVNILPATNISPIQKPVVSFFPNPMFDRSVLSLGDYYNTNMNFVLTDVTGKLIFEKHLTSANFVLSKNDIGKGFYFYHIFDKDGLNITGKILVY